MAIDMFINLGAKIKGESQDKVQGPKGDVDVLAWSWGASQSGSMHAGSGGGSGKANFQDLSFTKWLDSASPALLIALAAGSHIDKVTLLVRKAGEGQQKYLQIDLEDVIVTSVSTGGSGGEDRLTENVSLNFARVKFDYFKQDKTGATASAGIFNWDIQKNVKI